jgi:hypothetical protein
MFKDGEKMKITWRNIIHFKLHDWVEIEGQLYVNCNKHGVTKGIEQGWHRDIYCLKCLKEKNEDFDK